MPDLFLSLLEVVRPEWEDIASGLNVHKRKKCVGLPGPCIMYISWRNDRLKKPQTCKQKLDAVELRKKTQVGFRHPLVSEDFQKMLIPRQLGACRRTVGPCCTEPVCGGTGEVFSACFSFFLRS